MSRKTIPFLGKSAQRGREERHTEGGQLSCYWIAHGMSFIPGGDRRLGGGESWNKVDEKVESESESESAQRDTAGARN